MTAEAIRELFDRAQSALGLAEGTAQEDEVAFIAACIEKNSVEATDSIAWMELLAELLPLAPVGEPRRQLLGAVCNRLAQPAPNHHTSDKFVAMALSFILDDALDLAEGDSGGGEPMALLLRRTLAILARNPSYVMPSVLGILAELFAAFSSDAAARTAIMAALRQLFAICNANALLHIDDQYFSTQAREACIGVLQSIYYFLEIFSRVLLLASSRFFACLLAKSLKRLLCV